MSHVVIVGFFTARLLDQLISLLLQNSNLPFETLRVFLVCRFELIVIVFQVPVALFQLIDVLALLDELLVVQPDVVLQALVLGSHLAETLQQAS